MKKLFEKKEIIESMKLFTAKVKKRNIREEYFIFNIKMREVNNDENFIEEFIKNVLISNFTIEQQQNH